MNRRLQEMLAAHAARQAEFDRKLEAATIEVASLTQQADALDRSLTAQSEALAVWAQADQ